MNGSSDLIPLNDFINLSAYTQYVEDKKKLMTSEAEMARVLNTLVCCIPTAALEDARAMWGNTNVAIVEKALAEGRNLLHKRG